MSRAQRRKQMKLLKNKFSKMFKGKLPDGRILELGGMREEERDRIEKKIKDGFKARQPGPNEMTTKELEEARFSGMRINRLTRMFQVWADGQLRAEASVDEVAKSPSVIAELHERAFFTKGSVIDIEEKKT